MSFQIEQIPDPDKLFYRIHKSYCIEGQIIPSVVRNIGGGMSTDWQKYSTADQSRSRAAVPGDNGIVSVAAGRVRQVEDQTVEHCPSSNNRAHTEIRGDKTHPSVRLKILQLMTWEIPLEQ